MQPLGQAEDSIQPLRIEKEMNPRSLSQRSLTWRSENRCVFQSIRVSTPEERAEKRLLATIAASPQRPLRDTPFIRSHSPLPAPTRLLELVPPQEKLQSSVRQLCLFCEHLKIKWQQFPQRSPSQAKHEAAQENVLLDSILA